MNDYFKLGASMYVPATRGDLLEHGLGRKSVTPSSIIYCTEDAVKSSDVHVALANLEDTLPWLNRVERPAMRFIRVRNPHVLGEVLRMKGIDNIDGFVLPKITHHNMRHYLNLLTGRDNFYVMPTLETKECYNSDDMRRLRDMLLEDDVRQRILTVRIGGNDLLNAIGVRRDVRRTIYDTAVGRVIAELAGMYKPYGINLSAPVFEGLQQNDVLREEVALDLLHGLFGKTAVHPDQISVIEDGFKVEEHEYNEAVAILEPEAQAVFRMNNAMCEPTTHTTWARSVLERARIYGVVREQSTANLFGTQDARQRLVVLA